ncbi:hypothetical protein GX50_06623 [[Emmonsia] crescens]|uniref:Uncharacterized protein n=1 Tax=[Emmonsia] crescens TaxID=73230 RepID=A0A2B7ZBQ2_9EURO|nr:hypothetical protein GX50_06623 [Emmonsia crescens]
MEPSEKENDYDTTDHNIPISSPYTTPPPNSTTAPYPYSYLCAVTNKFTPKKFSRSLRNGPPMFLIGPAMIPSVLKYILSAQPSLDIAQDMTPATLHAHTLYCVRPLPKTAALDTTYLVPLQSSSTTSSPLTTVTGLVIFNLTAAQRKWLRHFEVAPFKQLVPVRVTIYLSNGECEIIDAGAFVEIIKTTETPTATTTTTTSLFTSPSASASGSINWLLASDMQQYRCDAWDITPFLASTLYKRITGGFEVWDVECGDGYLEGESEGGMDESEYLTAEEEVDREWELDEVEEVDWDEIEMEGGVEGEGSGWGKRVGMGVGVGKSMWENWMIGFRRYFGDL